MDKESYLTGKERHGAQEKAWPEMQRVSSTESDGLNLEGR